MKICTKCNIPKPLTAFHKNPKTKDGVNVRCKECYSAYYVQHRSRFKKYNASKRESMRIYHLKRNYGIDDAEYQSLLVKQNFCCAICAQPETSINGVTKKTNFLAVDHCHETNKVRGLLCQNCNVGIGKLQENSELIRKAADYLDAFNLLK